jgi:hypothetical protein
MAILRKYWHWLLWGGLAALIFWLWRRSTVVHATVTIPQDEIVVTNKSHSIVDVHTDASQGDQSSLLGISGPLYGPGF